MKTISLLNLKGGVAKTTTGGNIAKGLANRGFKTLLIDTDTVSYTHLFETIGEELKATYQETQHQLDKLDTKILEYVETTKTLPYEDTSIRDTIKNLTKERDDLRDTLYKVDKNIQYYQKSEQRLEAYQKNQSPKHKARDDDFEI